MSTSSRHPLLQPRYALVFAIIGSTVAIGAASVPHLQQRADTASVRRSLMRIHRLELARLGMKNAPTDPASLGFTPEANDRYAYFLADPSGCLNEDGTHQEPCVRTLRASASGTPPSPAFEPSVSGLHGEDYVVTAAANLDDDATIDAWSISSKFRRAAERSSTETCAGADAPAGEPCHDVDDLAR